ncbi:septum formation initiator family protein [Thiotrichales bacterium 19S3-7]|nr:septum formation initiator family protein [Thiotrichales bacterium 19S3-7]MCF6801801.1 septum formation initiator family protein [Thiotrichales bacterium 19S3-11]
MKLITVNRYFLFGIFLVVCLLALQYEFWYSETGYSKLKVLKAENIKLKAINQKDLLRNQLLEDEVVSLRKNDSVIEGMARKDLGLISADEVYYQFVSPSVDLDHNNNK